MLHTLRMRQALRGAGQPGAGSADADPARRPIDPKWRRWGEGYEVAFPDQYPLLLLSEARHLMPPP